MKRFDKAEKCTDSQQAVFYDKNQIKFAQFFKKH